VVTGQLADTPTRGLPTRGLDDLRTGQLVDWTSRVLDKSRTGQLADTPMRGLPTRVLDKSRTGQLADAIGDFACLVFLFGGVCETASCPVTVEVTSQAAADRYLL